MATKKDETAQITIGWHVQSQAPSPYSQPGNVGSNLSNEAILVAVGQDGNMPNPGYADGTAPAQVKVATPAVPASLALVQNTTHYDVIVTITGGTMTRVAVGAAGTTYANCTTEGTGAGVYVIPPDGVIGMTYTVAPTWAWTD